MDKKALKVSFFSPTGFAREVQSRVDALRDKGWKVGLSLDATSEDCLEEIGATKPDCIVFWGATQLFHVVLTELRETQNFTPIIDVVEGINPSEVEMVPPVAILQSPVSLTKLEAIIRALTES
jgi:hypothetical protein